MGEEDITSSTWNSSTGTISIPLVTDNISITIETHYLLTTTLENLTLNWDTLKKGQSFTASFVGEDNNVLLPSTVNVTMGGIDITDTAFRLLTNTIEIQSVTGNIVIAATAAVVDMNYQPLLCIFTREKGSGSNIPSNGIILPYKPSSNTKLELDVFLGSNTYSMLYNAAGRNPNTASSDSYPQFYFWTRFTNTNSYRVSWGNRTNGNNYINNRIIQTQKRINVICDRGTFAYENYLGSIQSFESGSTLTSWNVNNNLCIFAENRSSSGKTASYNCFGGLYRCKVSNYNPTTENYDLILDCIPVKRRSDGKLGIYDLVSGTAIINDENTMPSDRYMGPNILTTASLTNCTRTLLSAAETGTTTRAVIGSTWSVKLTPSSDYTFAGGVSPQVKIGNVDVTSQVVTNNGDGTYTITIVDIPQEPIEITAEAVALPYDAEVEYIESSGTQYIDSSIVWDDTIQFEIKISKNAASKTLGLIGYRFTSDASTTGNMRFFFFYNDGKVAARFGVSPINSTAKMTSNAFHTVTFDGNNLTIGGSQYLNVPNSSKSSTTEYGSIYILNVNTTGYYSSDINLFEGKLYGCTIAKGGQTVRDMVPVRKDNVGYLYDKVSGQLFGNAGSGAFTYGNDV